MALGSFAVPETTERYVATKADHVALSYVQPVYHAGKAASMLVLMSRVTAYHVTRTSVLLTAPII